MKKVCFVFILMYLSLGNLAAAVAASDLDLSGVWRYHGSKCFSGELKHEFKTDNGQFATYSIDTAQAKMEMRVGFSKGCVAVIGHDLKVDGNTVQISNPKLLSSNCQIVLRSEDDEAPSKFEIRQLPTGETALVLTASPGTICTGDGSGEIILTNIPLG